MINNKRLDSEPWCNPKWTRKKSLKHHWAFPYIDCTTLTNNSSVSSFLKVHHTTSQGTSWKVFSKSTNATYKFFFFANIWKCSIRFGLYDIPSLLVLVRGFFTKNFQAFLSLATSFLTFLFFRSLLIISFHVFLAYPLEKLLPTIQTLYLTRQSILFHSFQMTKPLQPSIL